MGGMNRGSVNKVQEILVLNIRTTGLDSNVACPPRAIAAGSMAIRFCFYNTYFLHLEKVRTNPKHCSCRI